MDIDQRRPHEDCRRARSGTFGGIGIAVENLDLDAMIDAADEYCVQIRMINTGASEKECRAVVQDVRSRSKVNAGERYERALEWQQRKLTRPRRKRAVVAKRANA